MTTELRPYQVDAIAQLRKAFKANRRVLYQLPTGGGKTVVFSWLAQQVASRGKRVMILAHRRELVAQASAKLDDAGVPHGIIDASHKGVSPYPVNVASVMTLRRRLDDYPDPPDMVVVDEAHHAVAGSWDAILSRYSTSLILGVTATPERLDGKGLISHFDDLVLGPSVRELIQGGYLANYIAYRRPGAALDLSGVYTVAGDYDPAQLSQLMSNVKLVGDALDHYRQHAAGKPAIAFCVTVSHAEGVAAQFRAGGLRAFSVDGTMGKEERAQRIGGLADGSTEVLTSCMLVSEGLDIPGVGAAILLRPTQSLALYLQQVGRTLRPKADGSEAILLDHAGLMDRHGMPCDERGWDLMGRPQQKKKLADTEVQVQTCFSCYATVSSACITCPHCGALLREPKPPPDYADGQLVATRPSWYGQDGQPVVQKNRESIDAAVQRCTDYRDLRALCSSLGYKIGWAIKVAEHLGWEPVRNDKGFPADFTVVPGWRARFTSVIQPRPRQDGAFALPAATNPAPPAYNVVKGPWR